MRKYVIFGDEADLAALRDWANSNRPTLHFYESPCPVTNDDWKNITLSFSELLKLPQDDAYAYVLAKGGLKAVFEATNAGLTQPEMTDFETWQQARDKLLEMMPLDYQIAYWLGADVFG